ncbi:flagellar hook-length control protein FliK [Aliikangiella maris]|uniref:Flagellar hook-length control protein FliK n=2 Tax=Aliikangiella maris TaxID=3162458 RepID=A0ABV2BU82_9GAMM
MRIPRVENQASHSKTTLIDKSVAQLLAGFQNRSFEVNKIVLSDSQLIQVALSPLNNKQLAQTSATSNLQLLLPNGLVKYFSEISSGQTKPQVQLAVVNNQLQLKLFTNDSKPNQAISVILFNQAKLSQLKSGEYQITLLSPTRQNDLQATAANLLNSSTQTNSRLNNSPQNSGVQNTTNNTLLQPGLANDAKRSPSNQTTLNINNQPVTTEQIPLKQAINDFLAKTVSSPRPLAYHLNQLTQLESKLLNSLNGKELTSTKIPFIQFNRDSTVEIMSKFSSLSGKSDLLDGLSRLFNLLNQLRNGIDFSRQNKKLNIANRLQSSGHFLESKWASTASIDQPAKQKSFALQQAQPTNAPLNLKSHKENQQPLAKTQLPQTLLQSNKQSEKNLQTTHMSETQQPTENMGKSLKQSTDLKFISLQIKTLLEQLNNITNTHLFKPILADKLFKQLITMPELQLIISALKIDHSGTAEKSLLPAATQGSPSTASAHLSSSNTQQANPSQSIVSQQHQTENLNKLLFRSSELNRLFESLQHFDKSSAKMTSQQIQLLANNQQRILGEMLNEINQTLVKIEHNQLLSLKNESVSLQQFLVDMPIFHKGKIDSFELLFEGEGQHNKKMVKKSWSVTIRFDLAPLGPMFARVTLCGERISTRFFAAKSSTNDLLIDNLDRLKDSFLAAGLEIEELNGNQGIVPETLLDNVESKVDMRI